MRRRLLLVEDDPTLRQALTFNLTREGYEVTSAADGGPPSRPPAATGSTSFCST
jgi:DNA-binding response OmpR family regulator